MMQFKFYTLRSLHILEQCDTVANLIKRKSPLDLLTERCNCK